MSGQIFLKKDNFGSDKFCLFSNDTFRVEAFCYTSGVEALTVTNDQGSITVLPFMGQMIWDAEFRGVNMKMENMFKEPKQTSQIIGTYGCFAYHSGLIRNGCPAPEDDHALHGEMPCAKMDNAWLGDLDGDGDIDVVTTEENGGWGVIWFENPTAIR